MQACEGGWPPGVSDKRDIRPTRWVRGYREVLVRGGNWHGQRLPRHGRLYIRLAPTEYPAAVVTFAMNDGSPDSYIAPSQVSDMRAEKRYLEK